MVPSNLRFPPSTHSAVGRHSYGRPGTLRHAFGSCGRYFMSCRHRTSAIEYGFYQRLAQNRVLRGFKGLEIGIASLMDLPRRRPRGQGDEGLLSSIYLPARLTNGGQHSWPPIFRDQAMLNPILLYLRK
jgi:hypothetical protein